MCTCYARHTINRHHVEINQDGTLASVLVPLGALISTASPGAAVGDGVKGTVFISITVSAGALVVLAAICALATADATAPEAVAAEDMPPFFVTFLFRLDPFLAASLGGLGGFRV
eukprot:CAMPEP_0167788774 /NCGR_PEP_ID=MMETSP0111_2-20121227/10240_1 /TAXON_ID=91324 /ORGANISM="Lotharella globosa, Strain CCCM811" /LENGTH=114 /DNA_ID=CAMNT_0007680715 /DNA_START=146 /DNA_END=490 /DNA_ORIENTATION=+